MELGKQEACPGQSSRLPEDFMRRRGGGAKGGKKVQDLAG